jgi:hypothetical protein
LNETTNFTEQGGYEADALVVDESELPFSTDTPVDISLDFSLESDFFSVVLGLLLTEPLDLPLRLSVT